MTHLHFYFFFASWGVVHAVWLYVAAAFFLTGSYLSGQLQVQKLQEVMCEHLDVTSVTSYKWEKRTEFGGVI